MPTFLEATSNFLKGQLCAALGRLDDAITLVGDLVLAPDPPLNVPRALGALICDKPPDALEEPEAPPSEGQCPAVYLVQFSPTRGSGAVDTPFTRPVRGPIGGTRFLEPDNQWQIFCTAISSNTTQCATLGDEGPAWRSIGLGGSAYVGGSLAVDIQGRCDGQPDDCGGGGPVYPEPGDQIDFGDDITYNIDDGTEITVPVTGIFAPIYVDLDGSLRIPVNIDVGGVELSGEVTIAPEFTINLQPKGIKTGPGKPDDPDLGPGQPGVPVPEDEEDVDVIVGVLVFSTLQSDAQNATGFPSVGGPTFLVPRLGSVQFAIKTGNSIGWTSDLDVKNLECYVPCPVPQGAIAVRVTPIAGVTRTFTPVRGKPLTSF